MKLAILAAMAASFCLAQPTLPHAVPMPTPEIQYLDAAGKPLAGGKLCTYAAGADTPLATYTDSTAGTPNTNPVVLNTAGRASVWVGPQLYKFVLRTGGSAYPAADSCTTGTIQWTQDNVADTTLYFANYVKTVGTCTLVTFTATGTGSVTRTCSEKLGDLATSQDYSLAAGVSSIQALADAGMIAGGASSRYPDTCCLSSTKTLTLFGEESGKSNNQPLSIWNGVAFVTAFNTDLTAFGFRAAFGNLGGGEVTALGSYAGWGNHGAFSTFVGFDAGDSNSQPNVTFVGDSAGVHNTGLNSQGFGVEALSMNTGNNSTAVGNSAGGRNSGTYLVAVGETAGIDNTGDGLVALGSSTAANNTGDEVIALGASAARNNTGDNLVAVGELAGFGNTKDNATFVGYGSGLNNSGIDVTASGWKAAYTNTGDTVAAFGSQAGLANSGDDFTGVGVNAGLGNSGVSFTGVGTNAGNGNTKPAVTVIGDSAGKLQSGMNLVALGVSAGQANTADNVTSVGTTAGYQNTGAGGTFIGAGAGYQNTGNDVTAVGFNSGNVVNTTPHLGIWGTPTTTNNNFWGLITVVGKGTAPVVATPTVNHAACIKASGPPVVIGYCSDVVDSTGTCTCN